MKSNYKVQVIYLALWGYRLNTNPVTGETYMSKKNRFPELENMFKNYGWFRPWNGIGITNNYLQSHTLGNINLAQGMVDSDDADYDV